MSALHNKIQRIRNKWTSVALLILLFGASHANGRCFEEAGLRYGVSPVLLKAIAMQESAMKPDAINRNRNGTWDMGLMQINSQWLPKLARYGISKEQLWDPCVNVHVGAWILAGNIQRLGYNWNAIGAYNAVNPEARARYARNIWAQLQRLASIEGQHKSERAF